MQGHGGASVQKCAPPGVPVGTHRLPPTAQRGHPHHHHFNVPKLIYLKKPVGGEGRRTQPLRRLPEAL